MLTSQQKKALKAQAHQLKPVIITGDKGLTENIIMETDRALAAHELIKVRINAADRAAKNEMAEQLAAACEAILVHMIGHIAIIYREKEDNKEKIQPRKQKKPSTRKSQPNSRKSRRLQK